MSNLQALEITDALQWDNALVSFGGSAHPLQSWSWGEAKKAVGEHVERWMVTDGGTPVLLAQVFEKRVSPMRIRMAWVPRGPVLAEGIVEEKAFRLWKRTMARRGYWAAAFQPYRPASNAAYKLGFSARKPTEYTFLIDLTQSLDSLDKALDKKWRYGRNQFKRDRGVVIEDDSATTLEALIEMLSGMALRKGFQQYGDADFLRALTAQFSSHVHPGVSSHLFCCKVGEKIGGCALVLRVGDIAHYNWGAFDYDMRSSRVNEGLQWGIMERLREMGVTTYDLEGADQKRNPGVYEFKKRMGGRLIEHSPYQLSFLF